MRMDKRACIVAVGKWNGHKCLFKNRDRNYTPKIRVYHEIREGVEVLYLKDEITGWCEGLNEHHLGIVNAALAVAQDEQEGELATKGKGGKGDAKGATLRDGERMLRGLECDLIEDAIAAVQNHKKGLRGHTLLATPKETYSLEATWRGHDFHVRKLTDKIHVRTNHGQFYQDAGYTEKDGDSYLSSLARKDQAMKALREVEAPEEIAPAIYGKRKEDRKSPLNMVKMTDSMRTTTQMVLDLTDLTMFLYLIPEQVEYLGYKATLPKGYKPKLKLRLHQYTKLDSDNKFKVNIKEAKMLPLWNAQHNIREIVKQLCLLEDHLFQPSKRCADCIWKHLLMAEALAEEALTLDANVEPYGDLPDVLRGIAGLIQDNHPKEDIAAEVRTLRKLLSPVAQNVRVARQEVLSVFAIEAIKSDLFAIVNKVSDLDKSRQKAYAWSDHVEAIGTQIRDEIRYRLRTDTGDKGWGEHYLSDKAMAPLWTLCSVVGNQFPRLVEDVPKWQQRVRYHAKKAWAYLEDVVRWFERERYRGGGGGSSMDMTLLEEERVTIEQFQLIFVGWEDSPYQEFLPLLKLALKLYRQRADQVAPILLRKQLPMYVEWTSAKAGRSSALAEYKGTHITIYPIGLAERSPEELVKTLAHEMGHHVIKLLPTEAIRTWQTFLQGDYQDLNLTDAADRLEQLGLTHMGDALKRADPLLYLQLESLYFDPSYQQLLYSLEDMRESKVQNVRVPIHPITGYSAKNSDEAFCEAVGMLVAYGPRYVPGPVRMVLRAIMPELRVATRWVTAKFKAKKEVPKADGSGTTTVYEYGERQVANRHREKAERIDTLRHSMSDLLSQIEKDLESKDVRKRLTALAVGLINETYERVGNEDSAEDGHFGVTGWLKEHLSFRDGKAILKYVGKSGVKHEKTVDSKKLVSLLKDCCEGKKDEEGLFTLDDGNTKITSKDVNEYLKPYSITAKDLRGYGANVTMQQQLSQQRKKGPKELPRARKEKDAILKKEFQAALDATADIVGHEAATLRNQYLVPGLEETYLKDGTVMDTLKKATLTTYEKEQREGDKLIRKSPKDKPPRKDRQNHLMKSDDNTSYKDSKDPDNGYEGNKDNSGRERDL